MRDLPFIAHGSNRATITDTDAVEALLDDYRDAISGQYRLDETAATIEFWSFNDIFDVYDREQEAVLHAQFLRDLQPYIANVLVIQNVAFEAGIPNASRWVVTPDCVEKQSYPSPTGEA